MPELDGLIVIGVVDAQHTRPHQIQSVRILTAIEDAFARSEKPRPEVAEEYRQLVCRQIEKHRYPHDLGERSRVKRLAFDGDFGHDVGGLAKVSPAGINKLIQQHEQHAAYRAARHQRQKVPGFSGALELRSRIGERSDRRRHELDGQRRKQSAGAEGGEHANGGAR